MISKWLKSGTRMQREHVRRLLGIAGAGLLICALCTAIYVGKVVIYQRTVRGFTYSEPELRNVADGTYVGECGVDFISAKVQVSVKNGKLNDIRLLEHRNERGAQAEKILDDMILEQRIDVDTVAGATNSSKVIKKAVENALAKPERLPQ